MSKTTPELKALMTASNKAWRVMMNGAEADSRTVRGEEGVNYIAWCAAADAERAYREAQDKDEPCASRQLAAFA